jgi:hypothetical protein
MEFVIAGKVFRVEDLEPTLDKAFLDLHGAFLSNRPYNLAGFEKAALGFFSRGTDLSAHDKFFNNFTILWRWFLDGRRLDEAELLWEKALQPALTWEKQNPGSFIHKGTPFYFWGMTAILKGDLDRGYALMHQAVAEDARMTGNQFPDTPAFAFVALNYTKVDQAFREWLLLQAGFLNNFVTTYCSSCSRKLRLEELRTRFLSDPPSRDAVFIFAYALARLYRLSRVPTYALASPFAGQLEVNLLFDLSLVIDAAIKAKNPNPKTWRFSELAEFLSQRSSLGISKAQLDEVNGEFINNFDQTMTALASGTFTFKDGTRPSKLGSDLLVTYGVRNHGAHNVSGASVIWQQFENILQSLFNILFLCVETLY